MALISRGHYFLIRRIPCRQWGGIFPIQWQLRRLLSSSRSKSAAYQVIQFRVTESKTEEEEETKKLNSDDGHDSSSSSNIRSEKWLAPKNRRRGTTAIIYRNDGSSPEWHAKAFKKEDDDDNNKKRKKNSLSPTLFMKNTITHFLPAQYPSSVAQGYARFSILAFAASVAGSSAMVLSTQTLLLAVGVVGANSAASTANASIMAGALNWVLKDGIGQLGGVLFASKMGETKRFDSDPKRWRMLAALSLDGASLLEILSPLVWSSWVLPLACIANVGKNVGFLTASASRAAIHQSLAITGNLADVTVKAGSQSMAAGLVGTAVGIGLSTLLQHDATNFIIGFCFLSAIHQGCNYASLKAVPLQHFNRHRLHLLLSHYIETQFVLSPCDLADREQYFPFILHPDDTHTWLCIGSSLTTICPKPVEFDKLCTLFQDDAYLLNCNPLDGVIHLVFLEHATGNELVLGMYHAHLLREKTKSTPGTIEGATTLLPVVAATYKEARDSFQFLLDEINRKGWNSGTDVTNIEASDAYRLSVCLDKMRPP